MNPLINAWMVLIFGCCPRCFAFCCWCLNCRVVSITILLQVGSSPECLLLSPLAAPPALLLRLCLWSGSSGCFFLFLYRVLLLLEAPDGSSFCCPSLESTPN